MYYALGLRFIVRSTELAIYLLHLFHPPGLTLCGLIFYQEALVFFAIHCGPHLPVIFVRLPIFLLLAIILPEHLPGPTLKTLIFM